mmetsp:Transcript_13937/g.56111  ORF Transcript_13937/g.56111 Transcript_13937/m.56111 type:complete len:152 (-) Transcript_13937:1266-1721(-)
MPLCRASGAGPPCLWSVSVGGHFICPNNKHVLAVVPVSNQTLHKSQTVAKPDRGRGGTGRRSQLDDKTKKQNIMKGLYGSTAIVRNEGYMVKLLKNPSAVVNEEDLSGQTCFADSSPQVFHLNDKGARWTAVHRADNKFALEEMGRVYGKL